MVDTPWRFKSKQALWKYMGIGLERRKSGNGPLRLRVPLRCSRTLWRGAANSAAAARDGNPFADQFRQAPGDGPIARVARGNVARSMAAAAMCGMWKSGGVRPAGGATRKNNRSASSGACAITRRCRADRAPW